MEVSSHRPRPGPRRRRRVRRRAVHQPDARPPRLPRHDAALPAKPRRGCSTGSRSSTRWSTSTTTSAPSSRARIRRPGSKVIGYGFGSGARRTRALRVAGRNLVAGAARRELRRANAVGRGARRRARCSGASTPPTCSARWRCCSRAACRLRNAVAALARAEAGAGPHAAPGRRRAAAGRRRLRAHARRARASAGDAARGHRGTASPVTRHQSRLICVFGCGGERDRGKRPLMGAHRGAARRPGRSSPRDNPRGEDPRAIIADILAGRARRRRRSIEPDRRRAMRCARGARRAAATSCCSPARATRPTRRSRGVRHPFSDAAVARRGARGGVTHDAPRGSRARARRRSCGARTASSTPCAPTRARCAPRELFVALKGERFDGHDFLDAGGGSGRGRRAGRSEAGTRTRTRRRLPLLVVDDTRLALGHARRVLAQPFRHAARRAHRQQRQDDRQGDARRHPARGRASARRRARVTACSPRAATSTTTSACRSRCSSCAPAIATR